MTAVGLQSHEKASPYQTESLHFTAIFHYIKAFVEDQSLALMVHLACIIGAGLLWPLQVQSRMQHCCHCSALFGMLD